MDWVGFVGSSFVAMNSAAIMMMNRMRMMLDMMCSDMVCSLVVCSVVDYGITSAGVVCRGGDRGWCSVVGDADAFTVVFGDVDGVGVAELFLEEGDDGVLLFGVVESVGHVDGVAGVTGGCDGVLAGDVSGSVVGVLEEDV